MNKALGKYTELASYFLWEYTKHTNALDLWYCAEDIGFYLENMNIFTLNELNSYICIDKYDSKYINFVRNIAFRIHIFTNNDNCNHNWFTAEAILSNGEWLSALIGMSNYYREIREGGMAASSIRSQDIKKSITQ